MFILELPSSNPRPEPRVVVDPFQYRQMMNLPIDSPRRIQFFRDLEINRDRQREIDEFNRLTSSSKREYTNRMESFLSRAIQIFNFGN